MRNYVYPTVKNVMEVTEFKERKMAEAAIKTLKWLDEGAPYKKRIGNKFVKLIFNMTQFIYDNDCGTICCIAGVMTLFKDKDKLNLEQIRHYNIRDFFDIDSNHSNNKLDKLFYANNSPYLGEITPFETAIALRKYLKTGIVDWSHIDIKKLEKRNDKKWGCLV
jgi:hypothetical protein